MKKTSCSATLAALALSFVDGVQTAGAAGTLSVSATVTDSCSVSADVLAFGVIDPLVNAGEATDATAPVLVSCSNGTSYQVGLDGGNATTSARAMTSDDGTLDYSLYRDANRTETWGDNIGTDTVAGTGTGTTQTLTVYGRVSAGQQHVPPGAYADTVTVTVTY
ncbi:MAG: spore coat U domain-containing protein [Proteobacteria bacterium]|nr:spore coat U domain-containing protein [Pseudomonadota bacterium]